IDTIIAADSRTSLTTACRVLDRVIRSGRYWVPHWYKASHWLAYWDVFGRPATKPRYARGIPETWWYDQEKAVQIDQETTPDPSRREVNHRAGDFSATSSALKCCTLLRWHGLCPEVLWPVHRSVKVVGSHDNTASASVNQLTHALEKARYLLSGKP